jgi:hypothetical protein
MSIQKILKAGKILSKGEKRLFPLTPAFGGIFNLDLSGVLKKLYYAGVFV